MDVEKRTEAANAARRGRRGVARGVRAMMVLETIRKGNRIGFQTLYESVAKPAGIKAGGIMAILGRLSRYGLVNREKERTAAGTYIRTIYSITPKGQRKLHFLNSKGGQQENRN